MFIVMESFEWTATLSFFTLFFSITKDMFALNENRCVGYRSLATPEYAVEIFWNKSYKSVTNCFTFFIEKSGDLKKGRFKNLIKWSFLFLIYSIKASIEYRKVYSAFIRRCIQLMTMMTVDQIISKSMLKCCFWRQ